MTAYADQIEEDIKNLHTWERLWFCIGQLSHAWINIGPETLRDLGMTDRKKSHFYGVAIMYTITGFGLGALFFAGRHVCA